jgi:hypothetical protein
MKRRRMLGLYSLVLAIGTLSGSAGANPADLVGMWYGTWHSSVYFGQTGTVSMSVSGDEGALFGVVNVPNLGVFDTILPVVVDGNSVTIGVPEALMFTGTMEDGVLLGTFPLPLAEPPHVDIVDWQLTKYRADEQGPDLGGSLPPLFCMGSAEHSGELLPFEPAEGPGYLNYPVGSETWENQYRSYLRRDLMYLVKYAAAKVADKTAGWDYGNAAPLGLSDMSEVDGAIPGASVGSPDHPEGTHTNGLDIDTAYYQLYAPDNLLRAICDSWEGETLAWHCVGEPYALDRWRTALFFAYLSEHPRLRVIGVDGKAGPVLNETLDELASSGWIAASLRARIPLSYEVTDDGLGWYLFHFGHLHISMKPLHPILAHVDLAPDELGGDGQGRYITVHLELVEGYEAEDIDVRSVALMLDGHNLLYGVPWLAEVSDYNGNGIPDLAVKFDRESVLRKVPTGDVEITITGSIDGLFFQGTDTIVVAK